MRRSLMLGTVAVGVVALTGAALVPAGAGGIGAAPLTIEKEVVGPVPPGTEFTVTVECEDSDGGPIIEGDLASATVDFDEAGDPQDDNVINFQGPGTCTVTETETGGAASVSYACEGQIPTDNSVGAGWPDEVDAPVSPDAETQQVTDPCAAAGPQEDPMTVFIETPNQDATVTVTNTFPEPVPEPVVIAPAFTG